jgi:hypothetical protein
MKMPLYYGAGLKRMDVLTMIPKEPRRSDIHINTRFAQIAQPSRSDATTADNAGVRETRTEGKFLSRIDFPLAPNKILSVR